MFRKKVGRLSKQNETGFPRANRGAGGLRITAAASQLTVEELAATFTKVEKQKMFWG